MSEIHDLAVIGAGPVGLAAAAQARARGLRVQVVEAGGAAGHAVAQWGHVPMFSNWALNLEAESLRLLRATAWQAPDPGAFPTGAELVARYLAPLAAHPALAPHIRFGARVVAVGREGLDKAVTRGREATPFRLTLAGGDVLRARAVIDASGTWGRPAPAGAGGTLARGEADLAGRLHHGMPPLAPFAERQVAVIGGGHSALGNLIALAQMPGTQAIWLLRGADPARAFGGGAADRLSARGALGSAAATLLRAGQIALHPGFRTAEIAPEGEALRVLAEDGRAVLADEVIVATGFRPDLTILGEVRLGLDPALDCPAALAPLIDPNVHSCGTVRPHGAAVLAHPEAGFFIAGMKSYGRAPTFLMATGYEQVRSIVAHLAGDEQAAARVELVLPETGVCSGPPAPAPAAPRQGQGVARGCCASALR